MKRYDIHPLLFAAFPVLTLLAHNISEVEIQVAVRPLIISLLSTIIMITLFRLIAKDWHKAALISTFILILLFSYGHLYHLIREIPTWGMALGRHRYLAIIYVVLLCSGVWWIIAKSRNISLINLLLNSIGLVLLIIPCFQIASYSLRVSTGTRASEELAVRSIPLVIQDGQDLPSIYYIVLDTYTRGDSLLNDFNFDNSSFLNELGNMGFYVAECSRSNYSYTQASITAALNMDYIPQLKKELDALGMEDSPIWTLLKQSVVRRQLESIGYKTIAFDTGFEWSRISDADIYLGIDEEDPLMQIINPFEAMLIQSTAGLLATDMQHKVFETHIGKIRFIEDVNFPFRGFIERELFILDQLPKTASFPGPKFVFAHILIPHVPRVFSPTGEILADTGFYGGKLAGPINKEYEVKGYVGEIQFINGRTLDIVKKIIAKSNTPPIIIIQGDTGLQGDNKLKILNAYYFPDDGSTSLYPTITPVNSYRILFDTYFGTDYGLLPDESFLGGDFVNSVSETSPACILK